MQEWTEKRIRAELERQFNAELKDRKAFIREKVKQTYTLLSSLNLGNENHEFGSYAKTKKIM